MTGAIPWATEDPAAWARANRARQDAAAITSLVGVGGGMLRRGAQEYEDERGSPELAKLRAALGIQEEKATAQSAHPAEAGAPALTETAMNPGPWSDSYVPGATSTLRPEVKPTVATPSAPGAPASPVSGGLSRLGNVAMAAMGLPAPAAVARQRTLAQLAGQIQRRQGQTKLVAGVAKAIAGSTDPARAIAKMTAEPGGGSWSGLSAGDLTPKLGAGRAPNEWGTRLAAAGGDPTAAAAVAGYGAAHPPGAGRGHATNRFEQAATNAAKKWGPDYTTEQYVEEYKKLAPSTGMEDLYKALGITPLGGDAHPESDQSDVEAPTAFDPAAEGVRKAYPGGPSPPVSPPHPTAEHAAQRKAAVIRSARGIQLTQ